MADGFRITEAGDSRVSELGTDTRITENFVVTEAVSAVTGAGSVTLNGALQAEGAFAATGTGAVAFNAAKTNSGILSLSGTGALVSDGDVVKLASLNLFGVGASSYVGTATRQGLMALTGVGTASYGGSLVGQGNLSLSAAGTLSEESLIIKVVDTSLNASGAATFESDVILFGFVGFLEGDVFRETTGQDTRVTESGDSRIVSGFNPWQGTSEINLTPTKVPFSGVPWTKNNNTWSVLVPYVKHEGRWVVPERIYVKQSGTWTRTY